MNTRTTELRNRAAQLLRTRWVKGKWVRVDLPTAGFATWEPYSKTDMAANLDSLRGFLKRHGQLNAKPNCEVCAEGAIYLACALDLTATADDLARLFDQMEQRSQDRMACSIITFNDRFATDAESVIKKLFA